MTEPKVECSSGQKAIKPVTLRNAIRCQR